MDCNHFEHLLLPVSALNLVASAYVVIQARDGNAVKTQLISVTIHSTTIRYSRTLNTTSQYN